MKPLKRIFKLERKGSKLDELDDSIHVHMERDLQKHNGEVTFVPKAELNIKNSSENTITVQSGTEQKEHVDDNWE